MDARVFPLPEGLHPQPPRQILLLMNGGSGCQDQEAVCEAVQTRCAEAGVGIRLQRVGPGENLSSAALRAAATAREQQSLLVAAGGDGTVSTVAGFCAEAGVPLGIIPLGTFNYFARHLGIPDDPQAAARVLLTGVRRPVACGYVNGRLFLNNAAFGLYTRIIRRRETDKARFGRFRLVALLSGLWTVLQGQKSFAVRLQAGDASGVRRTSMVFVGNNPLQLEPLALDVAGCLEGAALAVILLRPTGLRDRLRLMLSTALKDLNDEDRLEMFCAAEFEVQTRRPALDVVVDGETVRLLTPLRFRRVTGALEVIVPAPDAGTA